MAQTRMFRDRVVSMEQTLEGGEKHLPLLKELLREALPDFEYREHALDHERDLFVVDLDGPDGARKRVCWTRMMLFDAERIPTMSADPTGALRARIVDFLRSRAARSEIVVTFRHLEDGWVDTPEPKREGRRRRRGGRGGRGSEQRAQGGGGPDRRPQQQQQARGGRPPQGGGQGPGSRRGEAPPSAQAGGRGPQPARPATGAPTPPGPGGGDAAGGGGKRRRRFRRRRRGGGGPGGAAGAGGGPGGGSGSGAPPA
jgi:hypothetical protein